MSMKLDRARPIPGFTYKWPEGEEHFSHGWEADVTHDGRSYRFRHGVGERHVYGALRTHTVTWINGMPAVEGVGADDFGQSGALLSVLRHPDKKHIRSLEEVPDSYRDYDLALHSDEIQAPYSRRSIAVKIKLDDLEKWAYHALLRTMSYERTGTTPEIAPVTAVAEAIAEPVARCDEVDRPRIVATLLSYGTSQSTEALDIEPSFTPHVEANRLVIDDPFAFLLAVIFDQGIPAERAWEAPYQLRERLGHLDPSRIASDTEEVARAINTPPKLHRYIEKMPAWVVSGAKRVVEQYDGQAEKLWNDTPTAREVQQRFDEFDGIGQKKAAMAVELLSRDLRVPIGQLEGSDIAFDVHVRRVFLRTCLAQRDDQAHMIAVARELHPPRPGELDFPAWLIGRQWCTAGVPNCPDCVLRDVCPQEVTRAALVVGS